MPSKLLIANLFEYALVAAGWWLLWRITTRSRIRGTATGPGLTRWEITLPGFCFAAVCVLGGWLIAQVIAGLMTRHFPDLKSDPALMMIVGGSMAQLCLIAGVLGARAYLEKTEPAAVTSDAAPKPGAMRLAGLAAITCIITLSIVHPVQYLWEKILLLLHLPTARQDVVDIFFRTASPLRLLGLSFMAVVLAPVSEELVFRAGLFRYLRGRVPRMVALAAPSFFFALLHVDRATLNGLITLAPLTALGIIFSLAYERTGHIAVPMLAHALFNLHTVAFLLLGFGE